jgi:hypothetical protein
MEGTPESKRSSSALIPILIVVAVVCVLGMILIGAVAAAAFLFLGVSMPSSVAGSAPTPQLMPAVTVAAVPAVTETVVPAGSVSSDGGLLDQMAAGEVSVDSVTVAQPGETIGPVLSVQVSNPGDQSIDARIACGTIFQPDDSGEQRLMVIQQTEATISPGETADVDAYVACIDSGRSSPSGEGDYSVGAMADDKLLDLANCLCDQDLEAQAETDPFKTLAVQFAIWSVSDNADLGALLDGSETSEGALGDLFSGPMGELLGPFFEDIFTQSEAILTECGVDG